VLLQNQSIEFSHRQNVKRPKQRLSDYEELLVERRLYVQEKRARYVGDSEDQVAEKKPVAAIKARREKL
jgi:hypothetical protein